MEYSEKSVQDENESLRRLQTLQSSILSAIPHALIGLRERTIFFANNAVEQVFGWKADELIGKKTRVLYGTDEVYEEIGRRFYSALERRRTHVEDFPCERKDGREIICRMSASVIGRELTDKGIVIMYEDITEGKRAETELARYHDRLEELVKVRTEQLETANKELEQSNIKLHELDRLKSLFIASMSHELRTPLNSIIGFTGILLQGLPGPLNDEQKKQLGMVKGSSQHLLELITDIIDLSKIEAGKIEVSPSEFDLMKVVRDVGASLGPAAERKNLSVVLDGPESLPVRSDQRRVRQVLVNLVSNAVKYTERGAVRIAASEQSGTVRISVRDTGPGIRAENMGKLFQFFSRITSADMPRHEGTGLGLYLSKKLMTLLGGDITAESEFGKGSIFTMTLRTQGEP